MRDPGSGIPICPKCGQEGGLGLCPRQGWVPSSLWALEGLRHPAPRRPQGPLNSAQPWGGRRASGCLSGRSWFGVKGC